MDDSGGRCEPTTIFESTHQLPPPLPLLVVLLLLFRRPNAMVACVCVSLLCGGTMATVVSRVYVVADRWFSSWFGVWIQTDRSIDATRQRSPCLRRLGMDRMRLVDSVLH